MDIASDSNIQLLSLSLIVLSVNHSFRWCLEIFGGERKKIKQLEKEYLFDQV